MSITPEEESIKNINVSIKSILNKECLDKDGNKKKVQTCIISDDMIHNISYFLSHKIPKCKNLDISLDNIKNGKIISRGSFGYSFLITNKLNNKIIIKIIVCNDKKNDDKLMKEIDLHKKISLSENNNFIKLYGYIINDEITSFLKIKNMYVYYNLNDKLICKFPSTRFRESCEIYTLLEAGQMDMHTYMQNTDSINLNELTTLFFDLLDFYRISQYFVKTENKIFIHSDIKPENIVLVIDKDGNKKIKLIDFGLSLLSTYFNDKNKSGTLQYYNYYFYYDGITHLTNVHRSPLFDIYSIIISYIVILLYRTTKNYIMTKIYDFDQLITLIESNEHKIKINELSDDTKQKIFRIFKLGYTINDFNKNNIKKYLEEEWYYDSDGDNVKVSDDQKVHQYYENMKIQNLQINDSTREFKYLPLYKYINKKPVIYKKYKENIKDDYYYLDAVVDYILHSEITQITSIA